MLLRRPAVTAFAVKGGAGFAGFISGHSVSSSELQKAYIVIVFLRIRIIWKATNNTHCHQRGFHFCEISLGTHLEVAISAFIGTLERISNSHLRGFTFFRIREPHRG